MNMAQTQTGSSLKTSGTMRTINDASSRDASDRQLAATKAAANNDHVNRSNALRGPQKKDVRK
jgi:hypothetical protein